VNYFQNGWMTFIYAAVTLCLFRTGNKKALPRQISWPGVPQIKTWCSRTSHQKVVI